MDLVDGQQHRPPADSSKSGKVAGFFNGRAACDADLHAHRGPRYTQGSLAEARWAVQKQMIQRFAAHFGRLQISSGFSALSWPMYSSNVFGRRDPRCQSPPAPAPGSLGADRCRSLRFQSHGLPSFPMPCKARRISSCTGRRVQPGNGLRGLALPSIAQACEGRPWPAPRRPWLQALPYRKHRPGQALPALTCLGLSAPVRCAGPAGYAAVAQ